MCFDHRVRVRHHHQCRTGDGAQALRKIVARHQRHEASEILRRNTFRRIEKPLLVRGTRIADAVVHGFGEKLAHAARRHARQPIALLGALRIDPRRRRVEPEGEEARWKQQCGVHGDDAARRCADHVRACAVETIEQLGQVARQALVRQRLIESRLRFAVAANIRAHNAVIAHDVRHPRIQPPRAAHARMQQDDRVRLFPWVREIVDAAMQRRAVAGLPLHGCCHDH